MITAFIVIAIAIAAALVPICFVQLLYLESLRLRSNPQPALEFFKSSLEERIGLKLEQGALAFSLVKHAMLLALAILIFASLEHTDRQLPLPMPTLVGFLVEALALSWLLMIGVGHLLPQLFYRRTSGKWLIALLPLLRLLAVASRPLLYFFEFLRSIADLSTPEQETPETGSQSEVIEALITAGAEEGLIEEEDRKLIQSVVEFGGKTVREVMTPRPNIVAIPEDTPLDELHALVVKEQYSRIPTYGESIDDITGFVHVRDMFEVGEEERAQRKVRDLRRSITPVPETKPVDDLLRLMQEKQEHMVVVVDEYGNTAGLATMEDLVEEIVGEIEDEHDPSRDVDEQPDGSVIVSGNFDLDHLRELFQFRPDHAPESTTVGGLVTEWLGHVPRAGEAVEREGLRLEVVSSDLRRVSQVRIHRAAPVVQNGDQEPS